MVLPFIAPVYVFCNSYAGNSYALFYCFYSYFNRLKGFDAMRTPRICLLSENAPTHLGAMLLYIPIAVILSVGAIAYVIVFIKINAFSRKRVNILPTYFPGMIALWRPLHKARVPLGVFQTKSNASLQVRTIQIVFDQEDHLN
jgi:hypothetical protein